MKILICPDKFKESLSAEKVAAHIKTGIQKVIIDAECRELPLADGGEGTVSAIIAATKGRIEHVEVHDPLMRPVNSFYGITGNGTTAVIEMAAASGLVLLKPGERNPMITSTFGTGELIQNALNAGCTQILIGIGGSATVDGGAGMAQALGIRFTDSSGNEIQTGGGSLGTIKNIDISSIDKRVRKCKITIASDVMNVLTGNEGAAHVFGPQKGASSDQAGILDMNLKHLAGIIRDQLDTDIEYIRGSGAAGGLGGGIIAFLGGTIRKGFDVIAEIVNLEEHVKQCDLIITGEGKIDSQTAYGKTPAGVAGVAVRYNKPVIEFAGTLGEGYEKLYESGFSAIIPIAGGPISLEESMRSAGKLLETAAERVARIMMLGK